ncbi:oligosaccharide flippase family protein [Haladaptatus sp. DYF46]|uniref:oligosaccharide flippase family protein n=1 Tax=Haladaptatus sp. DYF46 TaxID=2886041 RepID=UPI001E64B6A6|nr:oligosaccharide flippase family protein [Haladaptatus sp. DYF46]
MDAKSFARGFKASLGARAVHMGATGLLVLLLTRFLLTPTQYGILGSALAVFGVAGLFADLGTSKSAARYVTEYKERDPGQVPYVLRAALTYRVIAVVLVAGVFAVFSGSIARLVNQPELAPLMIFGAGYIACYSLSTFAVVVFQGFNRVTWSAVTRATGSVSLLVFVVIGVLVFGGAEGALFGYVVSYAVATVVGLGVLYWKFYAPSDAADESEDGLASRVLKYSIPLTATQGANVLDKRIDTILVGAIKGPLAVSHYYLAKNIATFIQAPAASLGFTISPTYGEQKAEDARNAAASLYETTFRHTLLLYVPAAAGLILVAGPVVTLIFGSKYAGAVPVVQVFSGYVVLEAVTLITSDALDYLGRAQERAWAKGATSAANFALNLVLIPSMGAVGAAWATVATHSVYVLVNLYVVHHELELSVARLLRHVAFVFGITLAMSAVVFVALQFTSGPFSLVGVVLLGGAVWAGLATASGLLDVRRVVSVLGS